MRSVLILLSFLFIGLVACSDDSSSTSSTSSSPWESLNGAWAMTYSGGSATMPVTATKNSVTWSAFNYSGSWSGNKFTGTCTITTVYTVTQNLVLNLVDDTHFTASVEQIMAGVSFGTENYTAVKQ